jgi:hypothetical protein
MPVDCSIGKELYEFSGTTQRPDEVFRIEGSAWALRPGDAVPVRGFGDCVTGYRFFTQMMRLMKWVIDLLFRCRHRRTTFPQTRSSRTYTACLECGAELEYDSDWITWMTPSRPSKHR